MSFKKFSTHRFRLLPAYNMHSGQKSLNPYSKLCISSLSSSSRTFTLHNNIYYIWGVNSQHLRPPPPEIRFRRDEIITSKKLQNTYSLWHRSFSAPVGILPALDLLGCALLYGQHHASVHHLHRSLFVAQLSDALRSQ